MTSENRHPVDTPSRRAALAWLAVAALTTTSAKAQQATFSSVSVDVSRLRELGLGSYADFIQASMTRSVQSAFAGRIGAKNAPSLVVRITSLQFASHVGGDGGLSRFGGGGSGSDYMDGEAVILNGRTVIKRHPQLLSTAASAGGAWYDPESERRRAVILCNNYASWLARAL